MRVPNLRLQFDGDEGAGYFNLTPVISSTATHRVELVLLTPDMEIQFLHLVDSYISARLPGYPFDVLFHELRDFAKEHDARYEWLNKCAYAHTTYCVSEYIDNQCAEYGWNYRPIENDKHARFGVAISHDQLHNVRFDLDFNYKFLHPFGLIEDKKYCVKITKPFKTNCIDAYTCRSYLEAYIRANRTWTKYVQRTIWKLLEYLEKDLKTYYGK